MKAIQPFSLFAWLLCFVLSDLAASEKPHELTLVRENFQRLFTTVETRNSLDRHRNHLDDFDGRLATSPKKNSTINETTAKISVQGFILSEDGKQKVWLRNVNGTPNNRNVAAKVSQSKHSTYMVSVEAGKTQQMMKPGQTWRLYDGQIFESYQINHSHQTMENTNSTPADTMEKSEKDTINLEEPGVTKALAVAPRLPNDY